MKYLQLRRRERHHVAALAEHEGVEVKLEVAGGKDVLLARGGAFGPVVLDGLALAVPAQRRAHVREDLRWVERLGYVAVRAQVKAEHLVRGLVARGHDDDGDVREGAGLLDEVEAVHGRHHEVHERQRHVAPVQDVEAALSVARGEEAVAAAFQVEAEYLHDVRIVLDDKDCVLRFLPACGGVWCLHLGLCFRCLADAAHRERLARDMQGSTRACAQSSRAYRVLPTPT